MQFSVSTWREMVKWILSWGAGITVLEPEPLRIHIETEIGMMLVQYETM